MAKETHITTLVFAGGIGLGAYQAGAYEVLQATGVEPDWVCGSSAGAVTAALIAGCAPAERLDALRHFWNTDDTPPGIAESSSAFDPWRHAHNWASVLQVRLFGSQGHFRPRLSAWPLGEFVSMYDLSPMRARIETLIDFDRLNSGDTRVTVALTDIETGELVLVDTRDGNRITPDLLLASCGFLPEFAPIEIDGRLLGDGGLSANAPIEPVIADPAAGTCYVIDLYARDGERPKSLQAAMERKADLVFGNQTSQRLEAYRRERELRARLADVTALLPNTTPQKAGLSNTYQPVGHLNLWHLSYRTTPDEAGPEKAFDLSPTTIKRRWREGALDMEEALGMKGNAKPASNDGMTVHRVRRQPPRTKSA